MTFDSWDAMSAFVGGDDPARAHVPDRARAVLSRWDEHSQHHEVRHVREA